MLIVFAALSGLIFGIGLLVAGMADPAKVLGFLDLAGMWNPSLAFVMIGAIAVAILPLIIFIFAMRENFVLPADPTAAVIFPVSLLLTALLRSL